MLHDKGSRSLFLEMSRTVLDQTVKFYCGNRYGNNDKLKDRVPTHLENRQK